MLAVLSAASLSSTESVFSPAFLSSTESVFSLVSVMGGSVPETRKGGVDFVDRLLLRAGGAGLGEPFAVGVRVKLRLGVAMAWLDCSCFILFSK